MNPLSDTPSPLYERVKDYVLANIGNGKWARDHRLPSEHELVAALGVSRMTINRALRELTAQGYLLRIQGVGTFVAPPKPQSTLIEVANISSEIAARGGRHSTRVILLEAVEANALLLAAFETSGPMTAGHSMILHLENDVPVQLEERFVNSDLVPDYAQQDFTGMTTYDYLQSCMPMTEVEHVISAIPAGIETAELLQLKEGEPCLMLHRRTWSGTTVATVNTLIYAGSRYSLGSRYATAALSNGG